MNTATALQSLHAARAAAAQLKEKALTQAARAQASATLYHLDSAIRALEGIPARDKANHHADQS